MTAQLNDQEIAQAASMLATARRTGTLIDGLAEVTPRDEASAEAISDVFATLSEADHVGWKIGATSQTAMDILGCPGPFAGRVFSDRTYSSGDEASRFAGDVRMECEFAFVLGSDLPVRDEPYTDVAEIRAATATVAPAIELIAPRLGDFAGAGYLSLIADHGSNGGVVLGERVAVDELPDLSELQVSCTINDVPGGSGTGAAIMGDPWNALLWLAEHLRARGIGMRSGEFVMSGTCTGIDALAPGESAVTDHGALGSVTVTLAP